MHGYDITDHNKLNAAIGSREEYDSWVAELHAHGMGQMLDFVPNHMGIMRVAQPVVDGCARKRAQLDVCAVFRYRLASAEIGPARQSSSADFERSIRARARARRIQSPFRRRRLLSSHYRTSGCRSRRALIAMCSNWRCENLAEYKDEDFYAEFQSILTALEYLPRRTETDPEKIAERAREKEIVKRRLERRCQEAPQVQRAIEKALAAINGRPGDPRSFDKLDELLNAQSYRLAFWRVAAEEINYRRFFDVNDLAAIRMELPEVFDATHQLVPRACSEPGR